MNFKEAYELPIGSHVEKKGSFSYLSWAAAVRFLREHYPGSNWTITHKEGLPYIITSKGCFVEVTVHHEGLDFMQVHPVLDNRNKPIVDPDPFQINTSIQRCLAKAIGIATGIGLALYLGEDLPVEGEDVEVPKISLEKFCEGIDFFKNQKFSAEDMQKWFDGKEASYNILGSTEKKEIDEHLKKAIAWLDENGKHGKSNNTKGPETVKCPESGKQAVKTDCLGSECHKECAVFGNNKKSKLEMKV